METVPFNGLNGSGSSLPRSFVFLSKVQSHKSLSSSVQRERRENFRFRYTRIPFVVDRFVTRIGIIWKRKRKRRESKGGGGGGTERGGRGGGRRRRMEGRRIRMGGRRRGVKSDGAKLQTSAKYIPSERLPLQPAPPDRDL